MKGLTAWPRTEWPNVAILFFCFRIMVGIGFAMIGLGLWSLWHRWRGSLFAARWLQFGAVLMGPAGFAALLAGWFVTERSTTAVPFNSVRPTQGNGKSWLTMNATKDSLKRAPGYKYDKVNATWVQA